MSSLIWRDEKNQGNLNFSVWELFPKIRRTTKDYVPSAREAIERILELIFNLKGEI